MTAESYFQWMRIWKWFTHQSRTPQLVELYGLLDTLWQEQRKSSTEDELRAYAGAWEMENIDFLGSKEYQAFKREMDEASGKEPD